VRQTLTVAEEFRGDRAIYYPHSVDFRGRLYPVPMTGLSPQGPDLDRGLLTFAQGKPLGTQEAADWLAIHGANTYGIDKVSFADRLEWVDQHREDILAVARDPLQPGPLAFWSASPDKWQFLAFCFEWAGYLKDGLGYVSSLPVTVDGSCNGIQHFSAMLRDRAGGAAVNLVPGEKPADLYQWRTR